MKPFEQYRNPPFVGSGPWITSRIALYSGGVVTFKILWSFLKEQAGSGFKICILSEVG